MAEDTIKIKLLGERILVDPIAEAQKSVLDLQMAKQEEPTKALVVAVGPGKKPYEEEMPIKVGDKVLFKTHHPQYVKGSNNKMYLLLYLPDVIAIIE